MTDETAPHATTLDDTVAGAEVTAAPESPEEAPAAWHPSEVPAAWHPDEEPAAAPPYGAPTVQPEPVGADAVSPDPDIIEREAETVAGETVPATYPAAEPSLAEAAVEPSAPAPDAIVEPSAAAGAQVPSVAAPDVPTAPAEPLVAGDGQAPTRPEAPASPSTVGREVARAFHAAGVRWAFTVPGESFLGLLDELTDAGIRVVATRHEGGAAFMAEAIGQLTGRPALVLGTRAVGGANLAIGVHTARQDSTPLIAVVGQVERSVRGREAFQEADLVATVGGFAKWAAEPRDARSALELVSDGLRQATTGRPGPIVLSLHEDLLDEPIAAVESHPAHGTGVARPDPALVGAVLHLLAGAERPVILAGAGVLRARCSNDLLRLADFLRVPVIATWRRGDVVPNDHPLFLGMTGYGAPAAVRERLEAADAILALGTRLSEIATFGYSVPRPDQRWAHVDLEPRGAGGLPAPDLAVVSDARSFIRAALDRLQNGALDAASADVRAARNAEDRAAWEVQSQVDDLAWDGPGVHPGRVVETLRRVLPDDAIVTTDAGNMAGWLARGFRFRRPGTFLGPTSGAMGYGLPAAIAAALVHRDRHVVAWTGDGGFAMTMAELETAVREKLRLIVLVLDNERFGTIRMHQERRGTDRPVATDLGALDLALVAKGMGANGVRLGSDRDLEATLRIAIVADRPTVIQLALDRRWVSVDDRPE